MVVHIVVETFYKKDKKYDAVIENKKTVSFGATGYSDFTKHEDRKKSYLADTTLVKTGRIVKLLVSGQQYFME